MRLSEVKFSSLVDPGAAEGGGEALVLLQVRQGVAGELHGFAWEPAADLVDPLLHPAGGVQDKTRLKTAQHGAFRTKQGQNR